MFLPSLWVDVRLCVCAFYPCPLILVQECQHVRKLSSCRVWTGEEAVSHGVGGGSNRDGSTASPVHTILAARARKAVSVQGRHSTRPAGPGTAGCWSYPREEANMGGTSRGKIKEEFIRGGERLQFNVGQRHSVQRQPTTHDAMQGCAVLLCNRASRDPLAGCLYRGNACCTDAVV